MKYLAFGSTAFIGAPLLALAVAYLAHSVLGIPRHAIQIMPAFHFSRETVLQVVSLGDKFVLDLTPYELLLLFKSQANSATKMPSVIG